MLLLLLPFQAVAQDDVDILDIVDSYTWEGGVRKLKEHLFELVREVNLKRINGDLNATLPFHLTSGLIKEVFERKEAGYVQTPGAPGSRR